MANANNAHGFLLYKSGQAEPTRRIRPVAAGRPSNLYIGDAYTLVAGNATKAAGDGAVTTAHGVVEAFELRPLPASPDGPMSQDMILAADNGYVIGIEDNSAEFIVQCSGIYAEALDGQYTDLSNLDIGLPSLRRSGQQVLLPTAAATRQFRVTGKNRTVGNNAGETNCQIIVHTQFAV